MRKKIFSAALATLMVVSLAACGKSNTNNNDSTTAASGSSVSKDISAEQYADTIKTLAENYKQYIPDLPQYKGIEVSVDKSSLDVSDDDVESYISNILSQNATSENVTEGVTADGDTVVLDYSGEKNGEKFSGGTATDYTYTIGSGKFISDLDKGLAGLTVGQEYDIPCTFPSDYSSSDLAGQSVIFKVTVTAIQKKTLPELTDDWIVSNASTLGIKDSDNVKTVDDFRKYVRNYLETKAKTSYNTEKYQAVWEKIKENFSTDKYPEDELSELTNTLKNNIESEYNQYGSLYGISDFETYIKQVYGFSSMDDYNSYADEYAKDYLLEKMFMTRVAAENNISVSADEIYDMGEQLAQYYQYDSYQAILDSFGNEMNSEVGFECLYQKMQEFLCNNAVEQ